MGTRLVNAPLFLAIAQVRHSPVLKLEPLIADFQERLRKRGFPNYRMERQIGFEVVPDPLKPSETKVSQREVDNHIFSTASEGTSFLVLRDSFSLKTIEYDTFDHFRDLFQSGLDAYQEIVAPELVSNIGLRYLDAVVVPDGRKLDYYVKSEFLGLNHLLDEEWLADYQFSETQLARHDQQVKARVLCRHSTIQIPPDLATTVRSLPKKFQGVSAVHAILDTDATYMPPAGTTMNFEAITIMERLKSLKGDVSEVFKNTVTDDALKEWSAS